MLHRVNNHRPLWIVGESHKALDAEKLCAGGPDENVQEKIERCARHRSVVHQHRGAYIVAMIGGTS